MSKIKYIAFFKKDAVFDSERIVGELLDVCEQTDLGEAGIMCKIQVVQGELVKCKDCKYKVETEDGEWNPEDIVCDYWASDGLEADDFCSRGERKKPTEF